MTVSDSLTANKIVNELFYENLVADTRTFRTGLTKSFMKNGHEVIFDDGEHNIVMMTSDDRRQDLMKTIKKVTNDEKYDLVFIPVSTGNKDYIEWVSDQTITRNAALANLGKDTDVEDDQVEPTPKEKSEEPAQA